MKVIIKLDKNLSKKDMNLMNKYRKIEFGRDEIKNFKKDYYPKARFFFLRHNNKIVAFATLRDININYNGLNYKILGICNIISIEKGKGYGKEIIHAMIKYLRTKGKTGLGFCGRKNTAFYKKAGLKVKNNFIKRFIYVNPKTREETIDNDGDGIYFNGKDNFIKKVISNKSKVYINIPHW